MRCRSLVIGLVAGALVTLATGSAGAASCSSLRGLHLRDTTIATAEMVPAHVFNAGGAEINIPPVCKVTGALRPTSDSDIKFEVWMPVTQWNHRFQGVGNGGFAGSISERGLQAALRQGFAAAATDTGHSGTSVDASWAPGHPEKVVDFGYRAVHLTTLTAKAIVKAFYGTPARYAYFASCSDGGREALMEAQRFPTDYNGIIAGAPANNWTRLQAGAVWGIQATLANPASYIPASKLPAISRAALAACGAEDGPPESYVNDPPACHFDPEQLLCKGADSTSCLTAPQVAALKKLYSGPRTPAGKQIYPGYEPGGELGPNGWEDWITGSAPRKSLGFILGTQFFANMVYDNAAWNFRSFNFGTDMESVDHKLGPILNATDPNLGPFKAHGGKLIIYHGWSDAAIPPLSTVNYYKNVIAAMGRRQARAFLRLYMVPGMHHCGGGPGPASFGGSEAAAPPFNAADSMFDALEGWVEHGIAPENITATKYVKPSDPKSGIEMTRPLCSYPDIARYKGSGNAKDASSFACVRPDAGL